jgi:hypothetical protein
MTVDALSAIEDLGDGHKWFKLVFDIVDHKRATVGSSSLEAVAFRALGRAPAGEIGFEALVPLDGWDKQILQETLTVDWGRILLRSTGAPTDRLLRVFEEAFELPVSGNIVSREISCAAVLLGDNPAEMELTEIHTKLFFNSAVRDYPESYAELYLNFDLTARRAYLMEKDHAYRIPLTSWLAGRYRQANDAVH